MAKVGSYKWEGRKKMNDSLREFHNEEIEEAIRDESRPASFRTGDMISEMEYRFALIRSTLMIGDK